jgi:hypothetical protein
VEPTLESVAEGLAQAQARVPDWDRRLEAAAIALSQTWNQSLAKVVPALTTRLFELQGSPPLPASAFLTASTNEAHVHPAFRLWPTSDYEVFRRERFAKRLREYPSVEVQGFISFLTPVWNTDALQLEELAESVLGQDLQTIYEWVILDNGSNRPETRPVLDRGAQDSHGRLYRSEANLGSIAGTRFCLERLHSALKDGS